ncbi:MAG: peptide deformylase [Ruminococcus sp.]|jgi:peptide deformylase|nr:peptide deformylase [Ruminococcus sp.]
MALRNLVNKNDPILHKKCRPVEVFDDKLEQLIDDLAQTNENADGAGIAAPQIGILRRVAVIHWEDTYVELINPTLLEAKGTSRDIEGCLSCPDLWGYVTRPEQIKIQTYNRRGQTEEHKLRGHAARAALHEMDHLDGILFTDKADEMVEAAELERREKARKKKNRGKR